MKLLIVIVLTATAVIHYFSLRQNRRPNGRFAPPTTVERYGVYVGLIVVALLSLSITSCATQSDPVPSATISKEVYRDGPYDVTLVRDGNGVSATAIFNPDAR